MQRTQVLQNCFHNKLMSVGGKELSTSRKKETLCCTHVLVFNVFYSSFRYTVILRNIFSEMDLARTGYEYWFICHENFQGELQMQQLWSRSFLIFLDLI